jgi:hypothetical protein
VQDNGGVNMSACGQTCDKGNNYASAFQKENEPEGWGSDNDEDNALEIGHKMLQA